ncbi:MAG TPA: flavodoxin-dependent (E)-4-hydroxy-3-methylbut-2-enyl-diphosphate synthase [Candidatus Gracilibacteria bacterium]
MSQIVQIGSVKIGGPHPIAIQSMTNTDTSDVAQTATQILELHLAGADIVRMTVNDMAAAKAVPHILEIVRKTSTVPLVGDFHFNGNKLLKAHPECAKALDKYRINPGNADDTNFREMVEIAAHYQKPVRIGVNGGSLDPKILDELMEINASNPSPLGSDDVFRQAMVKSALQSARLAEQYGLSKNQIVISGKMSEVNEVIKVYEDLSKKCDYALHLGLTEAGSGLQGLVSSSVALGVLLHKGLGDTIRVSLTPDPQTPRTREVEVCQQILQSLNLRRFRPKVTSCPGCGRTTSTFFQDLALRVHQKIEINLNKWKDLYPGVENLNIAVMGCVVNGPGESRNADIAISLPGKMEKAQAPVYIDGKLSVWLKGEGIDDQFLKILEDYIRKRFS